jgi:type VI secretion system protein
MPLTLTILNAGRLDNGSPLSLVLDRRGATIGRDPTTDWCLPDPSLHISSRHCEIQFRDGDYVLNDISTNGTFLNGAMARLPGPHVIRQGDVLVIGHFELGAAFDAETAAAMSARNAAPPPPPSWRGWESGPEGAPPPAPPASASGWDAPPAAAAISGAGPMSQSWAAPRVEPLAADTGADSTWGTPPPAQAPASGWSSPIAATPPPPPSADDVWGKIAASNVVDWARGGFGATAEQSSPPLVAASPSQPPMAQPPVAAPPSPSPATMQASDLASILQAIGLNPEDLKQDDATTLIQAGHILRRITAGLVVMLEARARAKSQMGAQGTSLEFDGNNPLKFARTPEQALAQLLNPPERGFMTADRAIEDAFRDLQAHQMATLKAMQGALRSTLDRFSTTAIRARAKKAGGLAKILPGSRDAALWKTYEREFSGVAQGSDEAFMDMFAKEFRKAYEEAASGR